jgi:hypothetical protein
MLDPSNLPGAGSYDDLLERMIRRLQQAGIDGQILEILQKAFEKELGQERVTLARPDRIRLFQQVAKAILDDVLGKTGNAQ